MSFSVLYIHSAAACCPRRSVLLSHSTAALLHRSVPLHPHTWFASPPLLLVAHCTTHARAHTTDCIKKSHILQSTLSFRHPWDKTSSANTACGVTASSISVYGFIHPRKKRKEGSGIVMTFDLVHETRRARYTRLVLAHMDSGIANHMSFWIITQHFGRMRLL